MQQPLKFAFQNFGVPIGTLKGKSAYFKPFFEFFPKFRPVFVAFKIEKPPRTHLDSKKQLQGTNWYPEAQNQYTLLEFAHIIFSPLRVSKPRL